MAMNPMQRKMRNAFLIGFLIAIIIGAVVAGILIMQNRKIQEDLANAQKEKEIALKTVYVAAKDTKKGEILTITTASVPSQYVPENAITDENIENYYTQVDENEEIEPVLQMTAQVDIKENAMLTEDLVVNSSEASTYRMVEYNMISLPSMLQEGDYIDIRLACLGYDSIVLSKIKVETCNTTTIWLKLSESQLLTLNYAIVESYIMSGTKLYATQYTDPAQAALNCTYIPDDRVIALIQSNISRNGEEWAALYDNVGSPNDTYENALTFRENIIAGLRNETYNEEDIDAITEGYQTETTNIQAAREALMGDLGY
ncbi:MAG: hypothetical protein J6K45_01215 [Clostridia bacterium]|nr:hypothetical protein [Clostridia bacterium]